MNRKHMRKTACLLLAAALLMTLSAGLSLADEKPAADTSYAELLFDPSTVHTIDLAMDDWEGFLETCPEKEYTSCTVTVDGETYENAAIRAKGNRTLTHAVNFGLSRYSFKISFGKYEKDRYYHGLDKLCLNNLFQDSTLMKEYVSFALMHRMGVPAPLCSYVRISVNGEYWGLYIAVEDTDKGFRNRNFGGKGELYKPENDTGKNDDMFLRYIDDDPDSYANIFNNAKTKPDEKDKEQLIGALKELGGRTEITAAVDTDEVMRYFAVNTFVVNQDSYTGLTAHNYVLHERKGRLRMIPWDYNMAFRDDVMTDRTDEENTRIVVNFPIDTPVTGAGVAERPMLAWILEDGEWTEKYHDLLRELMACAYENNWLQEEIDRVREMIDPYVQTDPTLFISYEETQTGMDALKQFCELRFRSIAGQLDGTIPSTSEGQEANPDALVDTDGFHLTDLGRRADEQVTGKDSD